MENKLENIDIGSLGQTKQQIMAWYRQNMFWDQIGDKGHTVLYRLSAAELEILAEKIIALTNRLTQSKGNMANKPATTPTTRPTRVEMLKAELREIENSYNTEGVTPEKRARALEIIDILRGQP